MPKEEGIDNSNKSTLKSFPSMHDTATAGLETNRVEPKNIEERFKKYTIQVSQLIQHFVCTVEIISS